MSARINVGTVASAQMGVARVDADAQLVTLTLTARHLHGNAVAPMTPALARGLAQLLNAAADRAESP